MEEDLTNYMEWLTTAEEMGCQRGVHTQLGVRTGHATYFIPASSKTESTFVQKTAQELILFLKKS